MRYEQTDFDPAKYEAEATAKLATMAKLCDLANAQRCSVSLEGMTASPHLERQTPPAEPARELLGTLRGLATLRRAVAAFLDNLPAD